MLTVGCGLQEQRGRSPHAPAAPPRAQTAGREQERRDGHLAQLSDGLPQARNLQRLLQQNR